MTRTVAFCSGLLPGRKRPCIYVRRGGTGEGRRRRVAGRCAVRYDNPEDRA